MDFKRLWRTIRLNLSNDKGKYLRRAHIFEYFGKIAHMHHGKYRYIQN